jgi:hypothetical protein
MSNWEAFGKDIDRVRELRNVLPGEDQAAVFAYVTAPLTQEEQVNDAERLSKETRLPLPAFSVTSAPMRPSRPSAVRRVYVYMYLARPGDKLVA